MVQSNCSSSQVCKRQFSNKQILLFHFVIYIAFWNNKLQKCKMQGLAIMPLQSASKSSPQQIMKESYVLQTKL